MTYFERCNICPRYCKVNRKNNLGFCKSNDNIKISRAALHYFEEPCISGNNGSGAIFFSGCNLKCVFCQNYNISNKNFGKEISIERLIEIFFELKEKGANNINLVTPTHFIPLIAQALKTAKEKGLDIPIVYNTSGYENISSLKLLDGLIDVYLPDLKFFDENLAKKYLKADNYFKIASEAIKKMYRQVGNITFNKKGLIQKGVIVRHLVMPGYTKDSKKIIKYLYDTYHDNIYLSIMNQYTPNHHLENYKEINRPLSNEEYDEVINYAIDLGIENAFIQEGDTCSESFIPEFNLEGVEKNSFMKTNS